MTTLDSSLARRMCRRGIVMLALSISALVRLGAQPTYQERPDLWTELQDGHYVCRVLAPGDTLPAEYFSAMYDFAMVHDASATVYSFSEARYGSTKLRLNGWKNHRKWSMSAAQLTDSSFTGTFTLAAGEHIRFYREIAWSNPVSGAQSMERYVADDTLDWAVELVRASDGSRLALLDSVGVLASAAPEPPDLYGTRPIMAAVEYHVPAALNGIDAFLRVRSYARGNGPYYPERYDRTSVGMSAGLSDPAVQSYIARYGGSLNRIAVDALESSMRERATLNVVPNPSRGIVGIEYGTTDDRGITAIVVYDAAGERVFMPLATSDSAGHIDRFEFPESGAYYIALYRNGLIIKSTKVVIAR